MSPKSGDWKSQMEAQLTLLLVRALFPAWGQRLLSVSSHSLCQAEMELSMDFLFLQRNQSCWTSSLCCVRTTLNLNYSYNLYSHTIKAWRFDVWIWGRHHSVRDTSETACVLSGPSQGDSKGTRMFSLSLGVLSFDISSPYTSETKSVSLQPRPSCAYNLVNSSSKF